jgi:hypothetical protein
MSYEGRRKKRRHKRPGAEGEAGPLERDGGALLLTIAKRPRRFDCCRRIFARGDAIVFRYEPRAIRCQRCAERDPEAKGYRTSIRWERKQRVAQEEP